MIVLSHHAAANILCGDHGGAADTGTSPMRHSAEIVCPQYKRPLWSDMSDHRRVCESTIRYGFVTNVERDQIPPGLSEDIIRAISEKKHESEWMLEWRLKALPVLEDDDGADLAQRPLPPDRLSDHRVLLRAEEEARAEQP